jgi:hypothetical protein
MTKFSLVLILLSVLPLTAFANVSDTVCDIDGADVSFDIGSKTPQDAGSRTFYALEIGKKGQVDEKGVHQILATSVAYKIDFLESNGDFSLRITSKKMHKLLFSAEKKSNGDGTWTTTASSSLKGFEFPKGTFTCH